MLNKFLVANLRKNIHFQAFMLERDQDYNVDKFS